MPQKDLMFVKRGCKYCEQVLAMIKVASFIIVDVDKMQKIGKPLPSFVKQVPLIFTVQQQVIKDDAILAYVRSTSQVMACKKGDTKCELKAATNVAEGPSQPLSFSFGEQNFGDIDASDATSMVFGSDAYNSVGTPEPSPSCGNGRIPKIAPDVFEAYMAQRRQETPSTMR